MQEDDQYGQLGLGIESSSEGHWDWSYPGFESQPPYACSPDDEGRRGNGQSNEDEVQSMQFAEGPWDPLSVAFNNSFALSTSSHNFCQVSLNTRTTQSTEGVETLLDRYLTPRAWKLKHVGSHRNKHKW